MKIEELNLASIFEVGNLPPYLLVAVTLYDPESEEVMNWIPLFDENGDEHDDDYQQKLGGIFVDYFEETNLQKGYYLCGLRDLSDERGEGFDIFHESQITEIDYNF